MKGNVSLVVTSVLTMLLAMVHLADDYSRGFSKAAGGFSGTPVPLVLALWLFATLVWVDRRSGLVTILLMSLLCSGLPVLHMMGKSGITGGATPKTAGALFFALTLLAVGTTAICSVMLAVRGLWQLRRGRPA
jgi:hypothetical protein